MAMLAPIVAPRAALGRRAAPWAATAALLAAAVPLLALLGCAPTQKADCDQLLYQTKYQQVLKDCPNPYQRASAYLGLGGFNFTTLANSPSSTVNIVTVLGLTPSNVTTRRQYIEKAVEEVNPPDGVGQAFALLMSAFLGLGAATEEYLDLNLDGTITQVEINTVVGAVPAVPLVETVGPAAPYFSVVVNGKPYLLNCTADAVPPICTHPATLVFDDPDGSGRLTTAVSSGAESADKAQVLAGIGAATSVGYPLEVIVASPPFTFNASATQILPDFLGAGTPQSRFRFGISGYLQAILLANSAFTTGGGQSGGNIVTQQIDTLVAKFDNGAPASCLASSLPAPLVPFAATMLGYLAALDNMYVAATGTTANPVPAGAGASYFMTQNIVSSSIKTPLDAAFGPAITVPAIPTALYGFPGGSVNSYKMFYTTAPPAPVFNADTATPRVDQAFGVFPSQMDATPVFAPNIAGDGKVSFFELLCAGS